MKRKTRITVKNLPIRLHLQTNNLTNDTLKYVEEYRDFRLVRKISEEIKKVLFLDERIHDYRGTKLDNYALILPNYPDKYLIEYYMTRLK